MEKTAHKHTKRARKPCWQTVLFCREVTQVWIKPLWMREGEGGWGRVRKGERLSTFLWILLVNTQMKTGLVQPEHDSSWTGTDLRDAAARWQTCPRLPSRWSYICLCTFLVFPGVQLATFSLLKRLNRMKSRCNVSCNMKWPCWQANVGVTDDHVITSYQRHLAKWKISRTN